MTTLDSIADPTDREMIAAGELLWRQGNASFTEAVMMLRAQAGESGANDLVCQTCKRPWSEAETHLLCPCGSEDYYNPKAYERIKAEADAKRAAAEQGSASDA